MSTMRSGKLLPEAILKEFNQWTSDIKNEWQDKHNNYFLVVSGKEWIEERGDIIDCSNLLHTVKEVVDYIKPTFKKWLNLHIEADELDDATVVKDDNSFYIIFTERSYTWRIFKISESNRRVICRECQEIIEDEDRIRELALRKEYVCIECFYALEDDGFIGRCECGSVFYWDDFAKYNTKPYGEEECPSCGEMLFDD